MKSELRFFFVTPIVWRVLNLSFLRKNPQKGKLVKLIPMVTDNPPEGVSRNLPNFDVSRHPREGMSVTVGIKFKTP